LKSLSSLNGYVWILRDEFSYVRVARGEEETAAGQPVEHEVAAAGHVVLNTTEYEKIVFFFFIS
jgi:hypothetical protein